MFIVNVIKTRELLKAAKKDDVRTLEDLLNTGVNVNIRDKDGMTPLMWAAYYCNFNTVELLLDSGADYSMENDSGVTVLKIVDKGLYPEIGVLLKEYGAIE